MRWLIDGLAFYSLVAVILVITGVNYEPEAVLSARLEDPLTKLVHDATDTEPREGRVEAQLAAGSYTYIELRGDDAAHYWAVTVGRAPPTGSRVRVRSLGHRRDYYSPHLQRSFPELVFGIVSRID